ncbi:MAG TPA: preprotein translocase subunit SecE [Frankiaceae bacterium]|jgi:preprotein translocase subunit SecE|nr:preprotein translocase subunit SecE [Frankiaceae bacterium]
MSTETHEPAVAVEPAAGGRGAPPRRPNIWRRTVQYYREIVSELRKVIWPGRNELFTYSVVVLVFVVVVTAIVATLDYGLTRAVLGIFG